MFNFFKKRKTNKNSSAPQNNISTLEQEFMNTYLQTKNPPIGSQDDAWKWVMERISYFKSKNFDRNKLYAIEENVLLNLTESYVKYFDQFREIVDDISPIIISCEKLLHMGQAEKALTIAEPYVKYVESLKDEYVDKQICCQNELEAYLLFKDFNNMKDMPKTHDNYTYLFVLYCRILDSILINTEEDSEKVKARKYNLMMIAKKISPWNSTVWEALSRTVDSEEEYMECISNALNYSLYDGELYGLGRIYANLAMHFVNTNPQLSQALCFMCQKYGGNFFGPLLVLSTMNLEPLDNEKEAMSRLKEANIQIGFSDLVKELHAYASSR